VARTAGAGEYAAKELAAAQEALTRAHDAVEQRDYRLALNHALDSRDRAQTAARDASDRKDAARTAADRAIGNATTALSALLTKIKAADAAHVSNRNVSTARRTAADAQRRLQEARAAFEKGGYDAAAATASGILPAIETASSQLDAPRRRR
jgi:hypothetical protein